jgi:hypothetical protein
VIGPVGRVRAAVADVQDTTRAGIVLGAAALTIAIVALIIAVRK